MNYEAWTLMVSLGFNAAVSVRVSNELGANHPKAAKFSVVIAIATSVLIGIVFTAVVLGFRKQLAELFTDVPELIRETSKLGYLLGAMILLNSIQPVLSGDSSFIAVSYQFIELELESYCRNSFGDLLSPVVQGIWTGMLIGMAAQTAVLLLITFRTKWQKEVRL
ncbi:MatE [Musa troglodytarum]|uniref:MatE n=1 Tax=Musa troglodytarum TaxID=320322 RepID=A0A9E7FBP5_9LILI|nr:MatE [Musa troglodytarum]